MIRTLGIAALLLGVVAPTQAVLVELAVQDFDSGTTWGFTPTPAFDSFSSSGDEWGVVNAGTTITGLSMTDNFVGALDLANSDNSSGEASLVFDPVVVTGYESVQISFDYDIDQYDAAAGDAAGYEVFIDGVGQGYVDLLAYGTPDSNGNNIYVSGTETINIADGATTVSLTLLLDQNGSDPAAFDNFVISAVPEPTAALAGSLLAGALGVTIGRRRSSDRD